DMDAARNALAAAESIVLRSGATVDMTPLLSDDASLTAAESLARVETALQQLDESVSDRTAERLSVLDTVLAGPAFQQSESLLDRLRRWLAELLARFFPDTDMPGTINPAASTAVEVVGWAVVAVAAIVLLLLLSRWLRTLLQAFVGDATLAAAGEAGDPATAAEARAAAGRSAQEGDYRGAVRQLYLAALLTLQEQRIASRDRSLTNREVLARVPAEHPTREHLQPIVEVFDDVWYGVHEPDDATFTRYQAEVDALQRSATQPPRTGDEP
ncbi:MAG: DUF4129 domain-containing protein, partial [Caldilineaceae bacterium]|nr:DUF4129 domain-containing protein [Caldilineaceae bacterium]